jgi:ketosteroid isomerase-like protein
MLPKTLASLALAFLIALGASGQAPKADEQASVRASVASVFDVYVKAIQALDADLWITNWDENGIKFVQGAPAIIGKAAISNFAHAKLPLFESRKMAINVEAVDVQGNLALVRGNYQTEDRMKSGGGPIMGDGWFLTVFKKQADGSWKIYSDCVGSRVPPK